MAGAYGAWGEAHGALSASGETGPLAAEFTDRKTVSLRGANRMQHGAGVAAGMAQTIS